MNTTHKDDTVENLESSTVQRTQALIYHITTAGANVQSACKRYGESVIEVLEGRNIDNSLWIMIHDIDQEDLATEQSWENKALAKANPLLGKDWRCHRKRICKGLKPTFQNPKFQDKKTVGRSRVRLDLQRNLDERKSRCYSLG
jgi:phage terminase large subunit-like protein